MTTAPDPRLARLLAAMRSLHGGDFRRRVVVAGDDEVAEICALFNEIADRNQSFMTELNRVGTAVGRDGRLGERLAPVPGQGDWRTAVNAANTLMDDLTRPLIETSRVVAAVAHGDLSHDAAVDGAGEVAALGETLNAMIASLRTFAAEVTRVAREVGTEGQLGGQAEVPGVSGIWKDLTENVNLMAGNLTAQVRDIASVATGVARGDLSRKITVDVHGEMLELKTTLNTMVDQLSAFAAEVTRVAREVGTQGNLGGQAEVPGVSGIWKDLTDSVNLMADNLTVQVRGIAQVATAVAQGDLTKKIDVDARGEILELKTTINTMVDQLSAFAAEVTRVAREVGTQGNLGGQAEVEGVSGTWKDLTDNVNFMADNLTTQVRGIARVTTAVARGDLTKKITVEAKGEVATLADTINEMVDTLVSFADEVTRVAREVGTEGILGGQARVPNVGGTWKDLTDNVNVMANNLTNQVRGIAQVTTAVAQGDLTKKIDVDARGEILELKTTINTMVDQLSAFAAEVTRVAREVGTQGILGGQAEVEGVSGTWKKLTESVNQLAGNLTTQVRAIAEVATAVTRGNLTQQIDVDASGEVAELKDYINQMIATLRETTRTNQDQDWLKSNLARISGLLQGHRDLPALAQLIMNELAPLVGAQHGAFFLAETGEGPVIAGERTAGSDVRLRMIAGYAFVHEPDSAPSFALGQSLVGQVAADKRTLELASAPAGYVRVASGTGWSERVGLIVLPVLFEGEVLGVIELASIGEFTPVHRDLLEQLKETIGVAVTTITTNSRTDTLLRESQRLTSELQSRQEELQESNSELEEKAELLERQNRDIELKTAQIEQARLTLQERAQQLALAAKVKSEFMANMSHELRTPLNSLLILAKLLATNAERNLTSRQVDFARTIHSAGSDLLQLINDILDLSKVEAGRMDVRFEPLQLDKLVEYVQATFQPLAAEKDLELTVRTFPDAPTITTDEQRVQQILRNLLSNAVKFTDHGSVRLDVIPDPAGSGALEFAVTDTGIGIAEDKLQLIFEAFQQADGTTSRQYGGTGLGLSISRELTQLLGGDLRVSSTPGQGSTFTLRLPIEPPGPTGPGGAGSGSAAGSGSGSAGPGGPAGAIGYAGGPGPGSGPAGSSYGAGGPGTGPGANGPGQGGPAAGFGPGRNDTAALGLAAGGRAGYEPVTAVVMAPAPRFDPALPDPNARGGQPAGRTVALDAPTVVVVEPRGSMAMRETAQAAVDSLASVKDHIDIVSCQSWADIEESLTGRNVISVLLDLAAGPDLVRATLDAVSAHTPGVPVLAHESDAQDGASELLRAAYGTRCRLETVRSLPQAMERMTLRLLTDLPSPADPRLDPPQPGQAPIRFQGEKVLVIDDDVRNVFALASALELHGLAVMHADNGHQGIDMLKQNTDIRLVLMDLMMPGMDGYATTAHIRTLEQFADLPIIAVTAKAMKGDREKSLAAGTNEHVTKPVDVDVLLGMIRTMIGA
ncbi:MAG TPA: HAMP domain-containing protein [Actinocrinis sp.]|nr:HAMP domain-containing protein [Actinocrinis sp.]